MKNTMLTRIRSLRKTATDAEKQLWYYLRAKRLNGYKFRRQYCIHPYIVDFICLSKKLIVECDGGHHFEQKNYDDKRGAFLKAKGYRVMCFWNDMVLQETHLVLEMILEVLEPTSPQPSPPKILGGEG